MEDNPLAYFPSDELLLLALLKTDLATLVCSWKIYNIAGNILKYRLHLVWTFSWKLLDTEIMDLTFLAISP